MWKCQKHLDFASSYPLDLGYFLNKAILVACLKGCGTYLQSLDISHKAHHLNGPVVQTVGEFKYVSIGLLFKLKMCGYEILLFPFKSNQNFAPKLQTDGNSQQIHVILVKRECWAKKFFLLKLLQQDLMLSWQQYDSYCLQECDPIIHVVCCLFTLKMEEVCFPTTSVRQKVPVCRLSQSRRM